MLYILGMENPTLSVHPSSAARLVDGAIVAVWFASYIAARVIITNVPHGSAMAIGAAILPIVPTLVVLWRATLAIRGLDELHRRVHLEALAAAFVLTVLMLWTLGLLELAINLNRDNWSYRHVWAYMPLFYFLGLALAWRRYR